MSITLSRNLKLRIDSNLTANSKYNLERLDLLGSTFLVDSTDTLKIRSQTDILIEPESSDLGGSGSGGTLAIGTASHQLDEVQVWTDLVSLNGVLGLKDQASSGTKSLLIKYESDLNGATDTVADRSLSIDMEGADREIVLGGSLTLLGGDLQLSLSGTSSLILPQTGTLATLLGIETLQNKTLDANSNTFLNIANASISNSAAIAYSKLNLTGSIVNSDVSSSAAIQYSKLNLTSSIVNSDISAAAAIQRSKLLAGNPNYVLINDGSGLVSEEPYLSRARGGAGQDQSSVTYPSTGVLATLDGIQTFQNKTIDGNLNTLLNISAGSLDLTDSITNSDIYSAAGISYSKLNLNGSILDADISASAGIQRSKLALGTPDQIVVNDPSGILSSASNLSILLGGTGASTAAAARNNLLPSQTSNVGKVLQTDGTNVSWAAVGTGSVTSVDLTAPAEFSVSGNPITTSGTLVITKATQAANSVWAGPTSGGAAMPAFRSIVVGDLPTGIPYGNLSLTGNIIDSDISGSASIALTKLAPTTASRAIVSDSGGVLTPSTVTSTELGYVSGVSSAIQTQLNAKEGTITVLPISKGGTNSSASLNNNRVMQSSGGAVVEAAAITASRALISDTNGIPTQSVTTSAELAFLSGVASNVQTQLGGKQAADTNLDGASGLGSSGMVVRITSGSWTTRTITAGTGLTVSNGDGVSGNPTVGITNTAVTPASYGSASQVATFTVNQQGQLTTAASTSISITSSQVSNFTTSTQTVVDAYKVTATWASGDGTTKSVTHSLGTTSISVNIYEIDTGLELMVDSITRTNSNAVSLVSSQAPTGSGWTVVIRK